jgi:hypothetical protein
MSINIAVSHNPMSHTEFTVKGKEVISSSSNVLLTLHIPFI